MNIKECEYWVSHYAIRQELKNFFFDNANLMTLRDLLFDLDCDNEFLFYSIDQFNKHITEFYDWYEPLDIAMFTDIKENDTLYTITRVFDDNKVYSTFKGYTFDEMINVFELNNDYLLEFIINNCWGIPLCKEYKYVISIIDEYKDNYAYDMISEYIKDNVNDDDFKLDDYFIDMIGRDEYEALVEEYKDDKEEC